MNLRQHAPAILGALLCALAVQATPVFLYTDYQTDAHIRNEVWFTEASDFKSNGSAWGLTAGVASGEASSNRTQYEWPEDSPWKRPFEVAYAAATGTLSLSAGTGKEFGQVTYGIKEAGNTLILDVEAANGKWNNITVANLALNVLDDKGVNHTWTFAQDLSAEYDKSLNKDLGRERGYAVITDIPYSLSNGFSLTGTLAVAWDGNNPPAQGESHFKVYGTTSLFDPVPEASVTVVVLGGLAVLAGQRRRSRAP